MCLPFNACLIASLRVSEHGPVSLPFLATDIAILCSSVFGIPLRACETFSPCPWGFGFRNLAKYSGFLALA